MENKVVVGMLWTAAFLALIFLMVAALEKAQQQGEWSQGGSVPATTVSYHLGGK